MDVFGTDGDDVCRLHAFHPGDERKTEPMGVLVHQDKKLVVGAIMDGRIQIFLQIMTNDYFLFAHNR
jgi:hypothetical protein